MKIYVCGDSTAASYGPEKQPITGWGQLLENYTGGVPVVNGAMGGRSTKSFLSEGRLLKMEADMEAGDIVLIQFTHNDTSDLVWRHTDPWTSFLNNLSIFIDTAREYGAVPVLVTPICRRYFRDGEMLPSHGEYPDAIRVLAKQRGTELIDMFAYSVEIVKRLGDEKSKPLYMHFAAGLYPAYPDGQADDTHTQYAGADLYAKFAAEELRRKGLIS